MPRKPEFHDKDDAAINYFSDPRAYKALYTTSSPTGHFVSARTTRILELLDQRTDGILLDVGCGPGLMIANLLKRNYRYYGLDASKAMIRECATGFGGRSDVNLLVGRTESLPFPHSRFDVVLCMGVLEYVTDTTAVFAGLSRVVKRDGIVIASMLNRASPYASWTYQTRPRISRLVHGKESFQRNWGPPLNLISEKDLTGLFECSQFKVVDVLYYDFNIFLSPLDRYFPKAEMRLAEKLESLSRSFLRKLGNGFIVKGRRL